MSYVDHHVSDLQWLLAKMIILECSAQSNPGSEPSPARTPQRDVGSESRWYPNLRLRVLVFASSSSSFLLSSSIFALPLSATCIAFDSRFRLSRSLSLGPKTLLYLSASKIAVLQGKPTMVMNSEGKRVCSSSVGSVYVGLFNDFPAAYLLFKFRDRLG
ncbi:hypothetical protein NL676_000723 [Syzygium grande]|nr:hypothetical protein NL676_000723 [Syzygium grande]